MPEEIKEIDPLAKKEVESEDVEAVDVLKKDFVAHTEIKDYEIKAVERVRGSARHSSKFSTERAIIEDNRKQIDILSKLSDHVSDLEKRLSKLELGSKGL